MANYQPKNKFQPRFKTQEDQINYNMKLILQGMDRGDCLDALDGIDQIQDRLNAWQIRLNHKADEIRARMRRNENREREALKARNRALEMQKARAAQESRGITVNHNYFFPGGEAA